MVVIARFDVSLPTLKKICHMMRFGHVLTTPSGTRPMGIESARSLRKNFGKDVAAVCFIPVHDNYLRNKVNSDLEGGYRVRLRKSSNVEGTDRTRTSR